MNKKKDITALNNKRCIIALILCIVVITSVFIGVVIKLVSNSTLADPDEGIRSFRYFTVLSTILMAFAASLCIPFEIDGLRNHNYHLPRWIVTILYCGACSVTVTFCVALCFISPVMGFKETMLQKANLYLHSICPISSIILFIFINDDHNIPFKQSFIVLTPLFTYAVVYWLNVFVIGEDNGGWRDLYSINIYFPFWFSLMLLFLVSFSLANIIRILHNKRHKQHKQIIENYYLHSDEYACANIQEAIAKLAQSEKKLDKQGDIIVPRRLIMILEKRYKSGLQLEELCNCYLATYLKKETN